MIELKDKDMLILLSEPDGPDAYYKGVRFDRCGVFMSIRCGGKNYADEWSDDPDPFRHDHICGPVEEFGPVARPGGKILKIGVGLLDVCPSSADPLAGYDRFRLYPVAESGERELSAENGKAVFRHVMPGEYEYVKTICLTGGRGFMISHVLENTGTGTLETDVYNHNFFTLGHQEIDCDRHFDFPFRPEGEWREDSVSAYLTDSGIRFGRKLLPGEKSFMGNLHACLSEALHTGNGRPSSGEGHSFSVSGNSMRVEVRCDAPMDHAVFWSNHRVACMEPYIKLNVHPGQSAGWTICYSCL